VINGIACLCRSKVPDFLPVIRAACWIVRSIARGDLLRSGGRDFVLI
jgi:hypothetical protein